MKFLTTLVTALMGRKPTSTDVILAAVQATIQQLDDHAMRAAARASAHADEVAALEAKRVALLNDAQKAANVSSNIGALLK